MSDRISNPTPTTQTLCGQVTPAIVTGGSSASGYTVALHENGIGAAATGSATLDVLQIHFDSDLSIGKRLIVMYNGLSAICGD